MNEDIILQELLQIISAKLFDIKSEERKIKSTSASNNTSAMCFSNSSRCESFPRNRGSGFVRCN